MSDSLLIPANPKYFIDSYGVAMNISTKRIRKWSIDRDGYARLIVRNAEGVMEAHSIARIVATLFIGPAPEGKGEVNHKDGDKLNNSAANLEWVSRS